MWLPVTMLYVHPAWAHKAWLLASIAPRMAGRLASWYSPDLTASEAGAAWCRWTGVHRGQVSLKGVPQPVTVMMLVPLLLSGQTYPDALPGSKAKLVTEARGLKCSVKLPPDP